MILFINTSQSETRIALFDNKASLVAEKVWLSAKNQSEELLLNIDRLIKQQNIKLSEIKKIVTVVGPGSYTGLRVGLSTANALSFAKNVPIISLKSNFNHSQLHQALSNNYLQNKRFIIPIYSRKPKITKQKPRR